MSEAADSLWWLWRRCCGNIPASLSYLGSAGLNHMLQSQYCAIPQAVDLGKYIVLLALYLLLAAYAIATPNKTALECAISVIGEPSIAKVHYEQQRFFIVRNEADVESLKTLIKNIQACLSDHQWSRHWSLSVFSEKRLAGYKDESGIIPFHANNRWAKGYLAEYDSETGMLTLSPVLSPKTIHINANRTPH
jgi:hypothetical protein